VYSYVVRGRGKLCNERNLLKPKANSGFGQKQAQEIGQTTRRQEVTRRRQDNIKMILKNGLAQNSRPVMYSCEHGAQVIAKPLT